MRNPFLAVADWMDENIQQGIIGAFIGLGIAVVIALVVGG
jgi:hypothetical protein